MSSLKAREVKLICTESAESTYCLNKSSLPRVAFYYIGDLPIRATPESGLGPDDLALPGSPLMGFLCAVLS